VSEDNLLPFLPNGINDVKLPVDSLQKSQFVGVDFAHLQPRDVAPSAGRVIAILQILRRQNEGSKEHAAPTLQSAQRRNILRLLHSEVVFWHVTLDKDQVVQSDLQGAIARARTAQSLLDESPERQNSSRCSFASAGGSRSGPNDFNHLSGRIDEAVDEVDLAVALSNELRRLSMVDGS
jgi:hypothetical protein